MNKTEEIKKLKKQKTQLCFLFEAFFILMVILSIALFFKGMTTNDAFYDGIAYERITADPSYCDNGIYYESICECMNKEYPLWAKTQSEQFYECKLLNGGYLSDVG